MHIEWGTADSRSVKIVGTVQQLMHVGISLAACDAVAETGRNRALACRIILYHVACSLT
jgi:hypothetical protein